MQPIKYELFLFIFEDDGQYQTDLSEVASRNADEEAAGHQQQQLQYHRRVQIEEATRQRQQQQQQHHQQQTSPSSSDDFNFELQQIKPNRPKIRLLNPYLLIKMGNQCFYIPEDEPNRNKYRDLIIRYGGVIVEKGFPTVILLSNNEDLYGFSKLKFIDDCIAKINYFQYLIMELMELIIILKMLHLILHQ